MKGNGPQLERAYGREREGYEAGFRVIVRFMIQPLLIIGMCLRNGFQNKSTCKFFLKSFIFGFLN